MMAALLVMLAPHSVGPVATVVAIVALAVAKVVALPVIVLIAIGDPG